MAIFGRIPASELGTKYTHYGWFGLCPVYLGALEHDCVEMADRNWIPSWWFSLNQRACEAAIFVMSAIDADYEPMWPMRVGGAIPRHPSTSAYPTTKEK